MELANTVAYGRPCHIDRAAGNIGVPKVRRGRARDARRIAPGQRPGGHVTATATRKRPPHRYDPVLVDQRTRLARRARTIERQLRAEVERLGRTVTVHDDILIGQLAACMVRSEVMRGEASRGGQPVSDEQLTRLANT